MESRASPYQFELLIVGLLKDAFSTSQATIVKQQAAKDELILCRCNTF